MTKKAFIISECFDTFLGRENNILGAMLDQQKAEAYVKRLVDEQEARIENLKKNNKTCCNVFEKSDFFVEAVDLIDD